MKKVFFVIFLISLTFIFFKFSAGWSYSELVDRVIATVNGKIITEGELQREIFLARKELGIENGDLEQKVISQMIDNFLLEQEAEERKIEVSSLEVEETVEKIRGNLSEEKFLESLRKEGFSLDEFKERLKGQVLQERLLFQKAEEIREEIIIREDEIEDFYQRLKAYLQGEEKKEEDTERFYQFYQEKLKQVQIAQIIVKGKDEAEEVGYLLEKGENFSTLAKNFSLTPEAEKEGNLGWFSLFQIKPSLKEEIMKLKKGEVSKMFKIEDDYYCFIKLTDERKFPFSEWRDRLKNYLFQIKIGKAMEAWIVELRSKAQIVIIEPSLRQ